MNEQRILASVKFVCIACVLLGVTCACSRQPQLPESAKLYMEAVTASMDGDNQAAVDLMTQVIAQEPSAQAYLDRGRALMALDRVNEAIQDCDAGLALAPENVDLLWLKAEAPKPMSQRFKGRNAQPPSHLR